MVIFRTYGRESHRRRLALLVDPLQGCLSYIQKVGA
jgi:hypothetical protein